MCKCCRMGILEDEFHYIFECPAYHHIRQRFLHLFSNDTTQYDNISHTIIISVNEMMKIFVCQDPYKIAKFISVCRKIFILM